MSYWPLIQDGYLLPSFGKIIHSQLYSYLEENELLSENQYVFKKDHITGDYLAIFDVLKILHENWNEGMYSGFVFVDF